MPFRGTQAITEERAINSIVKNAACLHCEVQDLLVPFDHEYHHTTIGPQARRCIGSCTNILDIHVTKAH